MKYNFYEKYMRANMRARSRLREVRVLKNALAEIALLKGDERTMAPSIAKRALDQVTGND